jgi:hypothetical protein
MATEDGRYKPEMAAAVATGGRSTILVQRVFERLEPKVELRCQAEARPGITGKRSAIEERVP